MWLTRGHERAEAPRADDERAQEPELAEHSKRVGDRPVLHDESLLEAADRDPVELYASPNAVPL
jgi:hypothetical protein